MADPVKIEVIPYSGYKGGERPRSFTLVGRTVEAREIVKTWIEEERDGRRRRRFFTIKGSDGKVYTLYYDETAEGWYLTQTKAG